MKPSFSPHDSTNQTGNNATYKTKIACPYGTVPILRNTKEFNTNAQIFAEKYLNPILADGLDPLTHVSIQLFSQFFKSTNIYIYVRARSIIIYSW